MSDTVRRRYLTSGRLGLVCGALALTISLGVPSEAAKMINGKSLVNNSVTGAKLKSDTITGSKVKDGSITGADVNESTLQGVVKTGQVAVFGASDETPIDNFTADALTPIVTKTFKLPVAGVVSVVGDVSAEDDSSLTGTGALNYDLQVDGVNQSSHDFDHELGYDSNIDDGGDSGALTRTVTLKAGSHVVSLVAREKGSGSYIFGRDISIVFTPAGSAPASLTTRDATHAHRHLN